MRQVDPETGMILIVDEVTGRRIVVDPYESVGTRVRRGLLILPFVNLPPVVFLSAWWWGHGWWRYMSPLCAAGYLVAAVWITGRAARVYWRRRHGADPLPDLDNLPVHSRLFWLLLILLTPATAGALGGFVTMAFLLPRRQFPHAEPPATAPGT